MDKTDITGAQLHNNGTMTIHGTKGNVTIDKEQLRYLARLKSQMIDLEFGTNKDQTNIFEFLDGGEEL